MNDAELERRLSQLVTRNATAEIAIASGMPQIGCIDTLSGLDGFLSKLGKSIKNAVKAPLRHIKAVVSAVKTGSFKPIKESIKQDVKQLKSDVRLIAPVAAVVANIIPGVGQVASLAISAGIAADRAKQNKKKAQQELEAVQVEQARVDAENKIAYDAAVKAQQDAQAVADTAASEEAKKIQAEADAIATKTAEIKRQTDELAARSAAAASQANSEYGMYTDAQIAAIQAQNNGLFVSGMTQQELAAQLMRQQLANKGVTMNSPEAQQLLADVATDEMKLQTAGTGITGEQVKKMLPFVFISGVLYYFANRRGR